MGARAPPLDLPLFSNHSSCYFVLITRVDGPLTDLTLFSPQLGDGPPPPLAPRNVAKI